jgi:cell division septation protein DedD
MEQGSIRNLDRIEEEDPRARTPVGVTLAFVALGGACVVFAAIALSGRRSSPTVAAVDPLAELVAQHTPDPRNGSPVKPEQLSTSEVTFPGILSDGTRPTTALAAVKGAPPPDAPLPAAAEPPPATDRLPVVPLPAKHVLHATPVVTRPRDALTKAASASGQITTPPSPSAAAGYDGGYQLQVSSFRSQDEAHAFAEQLRGRGHRAHVLEASVPGRGTWYRVRVGPFASQQAAAAYRATFESKEHVVPYIVQPTKDKVAGEERAVRPASRERAGGLERTARSRGDGRRD